MVKSVGAEPREVPIARPPSNELETLARQEGELSRLRELNADLLVRNAELVDETAQLRESVAARDAFLSIAAHELRNPMTPIVGRVQRLRRLLLKSDFRTETLEKSLEQIEWLIAQYVKRATTLLDVTRVNSGTIQLNLTEVNICRVVAEVIENFSVLAEYAGSSLNCRLPDIPIIRMCDRLAIEQILDNLVSNAIKYGDGRPIVVTASEEPSARQLIVEVRDGGAGIPPESQSRIFERFERAVRPGHEGSGFGVGLWVVRQLVDTMKGTITIASRPNEGSTFTISLPLPIPEDA